MLKPIQRPDFLKTKVSDTVLLEALSIERPSRTELAAAGSFPVALRYIFKRYYDANFLPTLMGDALLVTPAHFDSHMKPQDVEMLASVFWQNGFRLGEFQPERRAVMCIRRDFHRANYYAPREELLGIKGDVIDMPQEKMFLSP
jgi:hypothetical protein